jgi:hypothetical protein
LATLATLAQPTKNTPPLKPIIEGPKNGETGQEYVYVVTSTDFHRNNIYYTFDWGDSNNSGWIGPYNSGAECEAKHAWDAKGDYTIRVKAKDIYDAESD